MINGGFISDFHTKAYHFKKFFSQQCTATFSSMPPSARLVTNNIQTMTNIDKQLILKLISNLNPNKAHCHHGLSIRMYQKSSSFISKPLISIIFRYWPKTRREPQKGNNQILNIYWPVNLLLFYGKLFEKIIFNTIFEYLTESDFLNPNQPGLVILLCISLSHYRK